MSKKTLFYIHSLNKGGAERVLLTIAAAFAAEPGSEAVILTDVVDELEYPLPEGLRRISIDEDKTVTSAPRRLKAMRDHIRREDPDSIVVFMLPSVIRAVIALLFTKYRVIAAVRANPSDGYSEGRKRWLLFRCLNRCRRIVCQTEEQVLFFPEKLRKKCVIIQNPIFPEFAEKAAELLRDGGRKPESEGKPRGRIVAVGRLRKFKNHKLLIEAFANLAADYPQVSVSIIGEGYYREELEKAIREKGMENRIFLPGDSSQVEKDIADALVYVLTSNSEGMPNALMEAMALRLPVISTDCPGGGPRSLIRDGINGLLVPVGDAEKLEQAIRTLLNDGKLRRRLGDEAGKIVETNKLSRIVDQWKNVLE